MQMQQPNLRLGQGGLQKHLIIVSNNNLITEVDLNSVGYEDETQGLKIK